MGPEIERNWRPPPPPRDPNVDDPSTVAGKWRLRRREVGASFRQLIRLDMAPSSSFFEQTPCRTAS